MLRINPPKMSTEERKPSESQVELFVVVVAARGG